jgi:hypothetical protein
MEQTRALCLAQQLGTAYSAPLTLDTTVHLTARVLNGTVWSALESVYFTMNTVPASAANLVVSQIDYNPIGGNAFEFIELMNISAQDIDLTGVHFRDAVDFDFPDKTLLAAGARLQIVGDLNGFATRHGAAPSLHQIGPYVGNLNNNGERLLVVSDTQGTIKDFSYDNNLPWPTEADGGGYRLVLIKPMTNPDHTLAANWRGSGAPGLVPGVSDATLFAGDPVADVDGDGLNAFLEHTLGTSDTDNRAGLGAVSSNVQSFVENVVTANFLTLSVTRHATADDAVCSVEFSNDLSTWYVDANHVVLVSRARTADGRVLETWRAKQPLSAEQKQFFASARSFALSDD